MISRYPNLYTSAIHFIYIILSPLPSQMIDKMEAQNFGQIYLKYVNTVLPMTTGEKMMNPATSAHKVQSYPLITPPSYLSLSLTLFEYE